MLIGVDAIPLVRHRTGIGQYLINLLEALARVDEKNTYLLYAHQDFSVTLPSERFIKKIGYCSSKHLWLQAHVPFWVRRDKPDLFWGGSYAVPLLAMGTPKVVTVHDLVYRVYPQTLPTKVAMHLRLMLPLYVAAATRIMADSRNTADDLIRELPSVAPKTRVVPLAAHERFFSRLSAEGLADVLDRHGLSKGYILFVGTVEPRKGVDTLLRALALLHAAGVGMSLVIVGQIGWKADYILELLDTLDVCEHVRLLNYVADEDLPALYQGASVFAYPSLYEGFGLPVLEAMASGTPVITTPVSSLSEVAGNACVYVPPKDVAALCAALRSSLEMDEATRERVVLAGLEQAHRFSWQETARLTLQVFQDAVDNK